MYHAEASRGEGHLSDLIRAAQSELCRLTGPGACAEHAGLAAREGLVLAQPGARRQPADVQPPFCRLQGHSPGLNQQFDTLPGRGFCHHSGILHRWQNQHTHLSIFHESCPQSQHSASARDWSLRPPSAPACEFSYEFHVFVSVRKAGLSPSLESQTVLYGW